MAKKLTTEDFILKAKEIHGDKYDYSKVEYVNAHTKVIIICPIHGEFEQFPTNHLKGCGCNKCAHNKVSLQEFIERSKILHNNKYDYSKINEENFNYYEKCKIICPIHGEFLQTPHCHLKGGCNKCGNITKHEKTSKTNEDFIKQSKEIHGNKYDYSKTNYVNSKTKVCIICPIHGEFWQRPDKHLIGKGCLLCANDKKRNNTEKFIEKTKLIHGNKYDYSKVEYINSYSKVCIICPKHGEFWQKPSIHLSGYGCKSCHLSILEKNMQHFLIDNNIEFETQKKFDWLGKQSLDFYLPIHNIAIECQGIQHFSPKEFFGGAKSYIDRIQKDKRKYNLCKENKIKLLYFTNVNENLIPKIYFDTIYSNENDLLNAIKEYGINTRT